MNLPIYSEPLIDAAGGLTLSAAQISPFSGCQKKITIPNQGPLHSIYIVVTCTLKAFAAGTMVTFGLPNLLRNITLTVNDLDRGQYDRVNISGAGALLLNDLEDQLDPATAHVIAASNANAVMKVGEIHRLCYRIDFPHPSLVGALAVRSLLHTDRLKQEPVLTLTFGAAAEISATADPFSDVQVEVWVNRVKWNDALAGNMNQRGGAIISDLREMQQSYAAGQANKDQEFSLDNGCEYGDLVLWHESQGATLADLSANTTANQETVHKLIAGLDVFTAFKMKQAFTEGQLSRSLRMPSVFHPMLTDAITAPTNAAVTQGAPPVWVTAKQLLAAQNFGGALVAGSSIQNPAVVGFEFLAPRRYAVDELTGCLPSRFPGDTRWKFKGALTTPAGNPSWIKAVARRFLSDITPYKRALVFN